MAAKEVVTLLAGPGRENGHIPVVIDDDGYYSEIADLAGFAVLGLLIPTLDTTDINFYVSNLSGGDFRILRRNKESDDSMEDIKLEVGTGAMAISSVSLECLKGWRFVKIKTSAQQTNGPRTLIWIVKG